ncbi:MAG: hypothetical protein ACPGED_12775 [Flavobacteriales bacterium]
MNTFVKVFLVSFLFLVIGCSTEVEEVVVPVVEVTNRIDMSDQGLPLSFEKLKNNTLDQQPTVVFNEQLGRFDITLDESLKFCISEEQISIDKIKQELRNDLLFTYKFYDEGTDALLYQAVLPDGTEYLYQYVKTLQVGDTSYLMFSDKDSEFSLQQIKLIKKVINSVSPLE